MYMKYVGEGSFSLKYRGRMHPYKKDVVLEMDEKTAKELSKRVVGGEKQWVEASKPKPTEKKKGAK